MGTEAGESLEFIIQRKEWERLAGNGTFAWGIGSALGEGIELLLRRGEPYVVFSRMRSSPRRHDVSPQNVLLWLGYEGVGGSVHRLPRHLFITSRAETSAGLEKRSHYALFCYSETPLTAQRHPGAVNLGALCNLTTAKKLGFSQVTAVVKRVARTNKEDEDRLYPVDLVARLVPPFFARLALPVVLPMKLAEELERVRKTGNSAKWKDWVLKTRTRFETVFGVSEQIEITY